MAFRARKRHPWPRSRRLEAAAQARTQPRTEVTKLLWDYIKKADGLVEQALKRMLKELAREALAGTNEQGYSGSARLKAGRAIARARRSA